MGLVLVTPPAADPVTVSEVKAQLRIEHGEDDALLADMIAAATARLDGRDGVLGRALVTQTWRCTLDRFPRSEILLPLPPCRSVGSIEYLDVDEVTRTVDAGNYRLTGAGDLAPAKIRLRAGKSWPSTAWAPDAVTITFDAGFGDAADGVPRQIRHWIKMMVGHLYENREASVFDGPREVVFGFVDMVADFKVREF